MAPTASNASLGMRVWGQTRLRSGGHQQRRCVLCESGDRHAYGQDGRRLRMIFVVGSPGMIVSLQSSPSNKYLTWIAHA